jgi:probable rRNA maturation factor
MNVDVQVATRSRGAPNVADVQHWAQVALARAQGLHDVELTIRMVDRAEGAALNEQYRGSLGKQGATNVLAFPFEEPAPLPAVATRLLGDVVICAPVVTQEAHAQGKSREDHWAHLTIHGVLHLLGFDHELPEDAAVMEGVERELLAQLGIADPYADG